MRVTVQGTFLGFTPAAAGAKWRIGQILQNGGGRSELVDVLVFEGGLAALPEAQRGKAVTLPCRVSVRQDRRGTSHLSCVLLDRELSR